MTNKTISELPNFTGDTSMRLHVHKPGSSESLSLNDIGNLVTTGEGLQTGDVVLRPAGFYADALECNGAIYDTSVAPFLASTLTYPASGVYPSSINANSEVRFGSGLIVQKVRKLGESIVSVLSNAFEFYSNGILAGSVSCYSMPQGLCKTDKAIYLRHNTSGSGTGYYLSKYNSTGRSVFFNPGKIVDIVSAFDFDGISDIVCYSWNTGYGFIKIDPTSANSGVEIHVLDSSYAILDIRKVAGKVFAIATINGVKGLYLVNLTNDSISFELAIAGNYYQILEGNSEYVYLRSTRTTKVDPNTYQEYEVSSLNTTTFRHYFDYMYMYHGSPQNISFDSGKTWLKCPTMSGYTDFDYDHVSGEFVFVGGTGTTGSVNGSSGTIQVNAADFPSDTVFRVPNISSPTQFFKQYIIK